MTIFPATEPRMEKARRRYSARDIGTRREYDRKAEFPQESLHALREPVVARGTSEEGGTLGLVVTTCLIAKRYEKVPFDGDVLQIPWKRWRRSARFRPVQRPTL